MEILKGLTNIRVNEKDQIKFECTLNKEPKRVQWFNSKLKKIENALTLIRIMREMCQRTPTWSILDDYLLELIIDKCFYKNKYDNLALKFRTIFEFISSGILFMSKSKNLISITSDNINMKSYEYIYLNDPCNHSNDLIEKTRKSYLIYII